MKLCRTYFHLKAGMDLNSNERGKTIMGSRYFFVVFFAVFLAVLSVFKAPTAVQARENQFHIDLQKFPLYVKTGFTPADAVSPDVQDGSWQVKEQWYGAVIRRLDLPGLPKRAFLSPRGRPEQEWTFALPFTIDASLSDDDLPPFPGLYLATIGINWEIYLNGTLIKQEMHLTQRKIIEQHYDRDVIIPINSSLLQKGRNVLVFRIVGDPTDYTTGFTYQSPYYIADSDYITRRHNKTAQTILLSILAILGIYHFLFFAIFRENRYSLLCGFFFFGMSLYYLLRNTRWIHQFIPNTDVMMKVEYFILFFMILTLMAYTDRLCNGRFFIATKIYGVLCVVLAVSQLFFSRTYGSEAAAVWEAASMIAIVWLFIFNFILPIRRELKKGKNFIDILVNTYPGNLLIAFSIMSITGILDLLDSAVLHLSLKLTNYSIVVFALSVTFMLFRLSLIKDRELKEKSALLEKATNPEAAHERAFNSYGLTEREKEVARLMAEGHDNKDISERLFLSSSTIAFHVTNIFRKFGIVDGKNKGRALFLAKLINE
jgi:DNA-binding CsgD family transcriptional regulator